MSIAEAAYASLVFLALSNALAFIFAYLPGYLITKRLRLHSRGFGAFEWLIVPLGVGLALDIYLTLALSFLGLFSEWILLLIGVLIIGVSLWKRDEFKELGSALKKLRATNWMKKKLVLIVLFLVLVPIFAFQMVHPVPSSDDTSGIAAQHLAATGEYVDEQTEGKAGRIALLGLLGRLVQGIPVRNLATGFLVWTALLMFMGMYLLGKEIFGYEAGVLAIALLAVLPPFLKLLGSRATVASFVFVILSFYLFVRYMKERENQFLAGASLMLALSLMIGIVGFIFGAFVYAAFAFLALLAHKDKVSAIDTLIYANVILIPYLPLFLSSYFEASILILAVPGIVSLGLLHTVRQLSESVGKKTLKGWAKIALLAIVVVGVAAALLMPVGNAWRPYMDMTGNVDALAYYVGYYGIVSLLAIAGMLAFLREKHKKKFLFPVAGVLALLAMQVMWAGAIKFGLGPMGVDNFWVISKDHILYFIPLFYALWGGYLLSKLAGTLREKMRHKFIFACILLLLFVPHHLEFAAWGVEHPFEVPTQADLKQWTDRYYASTDFSLPVQYGYMVHQVVAEPTYSHGLAVTVIGEEKTRIIGTLMQRADGRLLVAYEEGTKPWDKILSRYTGVLPAKGIDDATVVLAEKARADEFTGNELLVTENYKLISVK